MLNKKEIITIGIITLVLAFSINFIQTSLEKFLYSLLAVFLVIIINVFAKKVTSFYLDSEIEMKIWEVQRFGFKANRYLKKPVPMGAVLPVVLSIATFGKIWWLGSIIFEIKPKVYRAAKRFGLYSYSEMTEYHIGLIAASGVVANLVFAVVGYLIGFDEFSRLNIYFAFYNILPLADLDGNKIYFGSLIMWSFLAALVLVGLGYAFFVI